MKKLISLLLTASLALALVSCGEKSAPWVTTEPSDFASFAYDSEKENPAELPSQESDIITEPQAPVTESQPEQFHETCTVTQPEPDDDAMVPVLDYIPDAWVELRYAVTENFTGKVIYDFSDVYLRYGTVKKLAAVQRRLNDLGYGLKIWDGFRPVSAQYILWEVCPDPVFVANPQTGFSSHSRGNTVDVTLVTLSGEEVSMPTGFDDFSSLADRNYSDCPRDLAENALLLQTIMEAEGFTGYYGEWWHFSDTVSYSVEQAFTPLPLHWRYARCDEFITLREAAAVSSQEILRIPRAAEFQVLARQGEFLLVRFENIRGYVLENYTADYL